MEEKKEEIKHERCRYCGTLRHVTDLKEVEIWENHTTRMYLFCIDKPCGSYYQMGAEG